MSVRDREITYGLLLVAGIVLLIVTIMLLYTASS
jgi:hypothetical protein